MPHSLQINPPKSTGRSLPCAILTPSPAHTALFCRSILKNRLFVLPCKKPSVISFPHSGQFIQSSSFPPKPFLTPCKGLSCHGISCNGISYISFLHTENVVFHIKVWGQALFKGLAGCRAASHGFTPSSPLPPEPSPVLLQSARQSCSLPP